MNKPLSCAAQDMLEAAIVQKRRVTLIVNNESNEPIEYTKVLLLDINSTDGKEVITFLTTDNQGGVTRLSVNTAHIISFHANDSKQPSIHFKQADDLACSFD